MNPTQATQGGYGDAFLSEVNADGSALLFSTYLGGNSDDAGPASPSGPLAISSWRATPTPATSPR